MEVHCIQAPLLLLTVLAVLMGAAEGTCPESDQIHCFTTSRCTRRRYICDGDNDCGDESDETGALCAHWRNPDCERNNALCHRNGRADCVEISHYCNLADPPCNGTLDLRICEMLKIEKLIPFDSITPPTTSLPPAPTTPMASVHEREEELVTEVEARLDVTLRHAQCPPLFTLVGEQCLSIFYIGNVNWLEARTFCKMLGGDLLSLNVNNFPTIMQHLRTAQMTSDFWVGGRQVNTSSDWTWVDNTEMILGSPYWAVRHSPSCVPRSVTWLSSNETRQAADGACFHQVQAPSSVGTCASMDYANYYYVSDENCASTKSPICAMPPKGPKEAL